MARTHHYLQGQGQGESRGPGREGDETLEIPIIINSTSAIGGRGRSAFRPQAGPGRHLQDGVLRAGRAPLP